DRRIIEEVVERSVVVYPEYVARGLLEIGEIEDHAAPVFAFDDQLDTIGVPVRVAAAVVPGQKMGAVHVLDDTEFHLGSLRTQDRSEARPGATADRDRTLRRLRSLVFGQSRSVSV